MVSFFIGAASLNSGNDTLMDFALFLCPASTFQSIGKLGIGEVIINPFIILELVIIFYGIIRYLIALHMLKKCTAIEGV